MISQNFLEANTHTRTQSITRFSRSSSSVCVSVSCGTTLASILCHWHILYFTVPFSVCVCVCVVAAASASPCGHTREFEESQGFSIFTRRHLKRLVTHWEGGTISVMQLDVRERNQLPVNQEPLSTTLSCQEVYEPHVRHWCMKIVHVKLLVCS